MIPALLASTSSTAIAIATGGAAVSLSGVTSKIKTSISPADAYAGWRFLRNGSKGYVRATSLSWVGSGDWVTPATSIIGDDYEIRATVTAGTNPTGSAVGSWLALSSTISWYCDITGAGFHSSTLTIEIRDAATSTVQSTKTGVLLSATVEI